MKEVPQFEIRMHRVDVSKTIFYFLKDKKEKHREN